MEKNKAREMEKERKNFERKTNRGEKKRTREKITVHSPAEK